MSLFISEILSVFNASPGVLNGDKRYLNSCSNFCSNHDPETDPQYQTKVN